MIDIHCHILPAVDDGASNWDMSLAMCQLAVRDGITHIVATPHANSRYEFKREECLRLLGELGEKVPELTFSLGCDFHLSYENGEDAIRRPERYAIGESRFLLTELSDYATGAQMKDLLFRLHCAGFSTVITHPERNQVITQYAELAGELVNMGSLLQITGDSLTGAWGRTVQKRSERLLKDGLVAILASDAHEDRRRRPMLSPARKAAAKMVGAAAASKLVDENPRAIISDRRVRAGGN